MTEQTPSHDRSDHMGAVRPDEPLDGGPDPGAAAGGAGNEPRSSADADRDAAFGTGPVDTAEDEPVTSADADRDAAEPRD
jgi:hypothetical protein